MTPEQVMAEHEKMGKLLEQYRKETFEQPVDPVASTPHSSTGTAQPAAPSDSKP